MEIILFILGFIGVCGVVSYLADRNNRIQQARADVQNQEFESQYTTVLPKGTAPIVRRDALVNNANNQYEQPPQDDSDFLLSAAVGAMTGNALAGGLAGGDFIGGAIGAALVEEDAPQQVQDDTSNDNSSDDSSYDDSSSSSDDSSSYDSGSSDSGSDW